MEIPQLLRKQPNFLNQISKSKFSLFIAFILRNSNNVLPLDITTHKQLDTDQNMEKFCLKRWKRAWVQNMKGSCVA